MLSSPPTSLLLVLAWDAADPALRRGGAAPAPVLPLLRALAGLRPLLAVLPQLPGGAQVADLRPATDVAAAAAEAPAAPEWPLATNNPAPLAPLTPAAPPVPADLAPLLPGQPAPGVLLLAAQAVPPPRPGRRGPVPAPPFASRVLGVVEALPAAVHEAGATAAPAAPAAAAAARLALRVPLARRAPGSANWLAPAAPYAGSAAAAGPAAAAASQSKKAAEAAGGVVALLRFRAAAAVLVPGAATPPRPAAGVPLPTAPLRHEPAPAPAAEPAPDPDLTAEPGPAEAAVPGTDEAPAQTSETPVPDAAHATLSHGLQALHRPETAPEAAPATPFALADDLHYRLIQYARFAAPLVAAQQQAIGLVYAADWPTWLAALELRYRCRCPLVLHLAGLAADEAAPAERGWLLELERYALRRAHTVLVASEALRRQVLAAYPALAARVLVVDVADATALASVLAEVVPDA